MCTRQMMLIAATAAALFGLPAPATADPVAITSGTFFISWARGGFRSFGFNLTGENFHIQGGDGDGSRNGAFRPQCVEFAPCSPGSTTSLSGPYGIFAVGAHSEIDDVSYDLTRYAGSALFSSPTVTIPSSTAASIQVHAPFTFSGSLAIDVVRTLPPDWVPVGQFDLTGQGTVSATLRFQQGFSGPGYAIQSIRYEFAEPVPEPATLLLLGTGLAGVVRARRRRTL